MDIHQLNEEEMRTDYRNGDYSKLEEQMKMAEVENMLWTAISEERKQGPQAGVQPPFLCVHVDEYRAQDRNTQKDHAHNRQHDHEFKQAHSHVSFVA